MRICYQDWSPQDATVGVIDAANEIIEEYAGQGFDLECCGYLAWNMRRVEVGEPWWGLDVGDNFPKECRLDDLVDYEKGCFLGQETLARMRYRGHPNWLLVGLQALGRAPSALQPPAALLPERGEAPAEPGDADAYRLERFAGPGLEGPTAGNDHGTLGARQPLQGLDHRPAVAGHGAEASVGLREANPIGIDLVVH